MSTLAALVCTPAGSCIVADAGLRAKGTIKQIFAGILPIVAREPNREGRVLWNNIVARAIGQHGLS